ncbi:ubiquitin-conjugating enzyme E2 K-like [Clavelina lepadiformis]|uniref:E2 ubiquitin-conjugating enzyme n=1 Tax=Clavelina lepadiformis TaxID=159417 RepID=A0ABP0FXR2_CLALP
MSSIATTRIQRELKDIKESNNQSIKIELKSDEFNNLRGEIVGPSGTPYQDGMYKLSIKIPETYPFNPPIVSFDTRIWHPNISSVTGAICLDILKDQWAAALTLRTVLLSLQALLSAAEPDDPQDAVVAKQYKDNQKAFVKTARFWAQYYANAPGPRDTDCVEKLRKASEMGFYKDISLQALSTHSWDLENAIQYLTSC